MRRDQFTDEDGMDEEQYLPVGVFETEPSSTEITSMIAKAQF
jgi:hypothetical protein